MEDLDAALAATVLLEESDAMARALADQELAVAVVAARAALAEGRVKPVNRAFARLIEIIMDRLEPIPAESPAAPVGAG